LVERGLRAIQFSSLSASSTPFFRNLPLVAGGDVSPTSQECPGQQNLHDQRLRRHSSQCISYYSPPHHFTRRHYPHPSFTRPSSSLPVPYPCLRRWAGFGPASRATCPENIGSWGHDCVGTFFGGIGLGSGHGVEDRQTCARISHRNVPNLPAMRFALLPVWQAWAWHRGSLSLEAAVAVA